MCSVSIVIFVTFNQKPTTKKVSISADILVLIRGLTLSKGSYLRVPVCSPLHPQGHNRVQSFNICQTVSEKCRNPIWSSLHDSNIQFRSSRGPNYAPVTAI